MTYRDRFFAGVDLLGVLDPANFPREQVNSCKSYLEAVRVQRSDEYPSIRPCNLKMATRFVAGRDPINDLGRRCHIYSDAFARAFQKKFQDTQVWFFSTIGEVKHRGDSVYNVTEEGVIRAYLKGFQAAETLDVHVWLTFEDMTIVDLTIMASLLRLGWIDRRAYDAAPVVFGQAEELADFEYVPYLVDNDFARRVDRFN